MMMVQNMISSRLDDGKSSKTMYINDREIDLNIDGISVKSISSVKLLGILLDCKLNFLAHVKSLCKSASPSRNKIPFLNIGCA